MAFPVLLLTIFQRGLNTRVEVGINTIVVVYLTVLLLEDGTVERVSIPRLPERDILENSAELISQHPIHISHPISNEVQMTTNNPGPYRGCLRTLRLPQEPAKRTKSVKEGGQKWNTGRNPTDPLLPRLVEKEPEEATVEGEHFDELN